MAYLTGYTCIVRELQQIFLRSPLGIIAALSVVALIAVSAWRISSSYTAREQAGTFVALTDANDPKASVGADWQQEMTLLGMSDSFDPSATSSTDSVAMIGPVVMSQLVGEYAGLQESGTYSSQAGELAAQDIASNVRATVTYKTYNTSEIKTDSDTSYARMLTYRDDMRVATAPLLKNAQAEFELFAYYIESGDASYLDTLRIHVSNYRAAASLAARVVVPVDARNNHIAILNSLEQFAAVVESMAAHADDPLASVALLRSYNSAESDMLNAFNRLASYERLKKV